MFTGLIEEIGIVTAVHIDPVTGQTVLTISASAVLHGVVLGDSIAVEGVCLTVTSFTHSSFTVGLSPETLRRTTFASLRPPHPVNLERSLTPTSHIGGHFVQGHVDCTGELTIVQADGDALRVVVRAPASLLQYVVEKGYIAIDGASLTVVRVEEGKQAGGEGELEVMLIQYTQQRVTLARKQSGQRVNLEADVMGKQIVAYLDRYTKALKARL